MILKSGKTVTGFSRCTKLMTEHTHRPLHTPDSLGYDDQGKWPEKEICLLIVCWAPLSTNALTEYELTSTGMLESH